LASLTVRYFAAARAASGTDVEQLTMPSERCTVDEVLRELSARHGPNLSRVLPACSFLLDEVAVRSRSVQLSDGSVLDVLPPFAGG
jgi:molybdopterin synthase sulfur carrier subunit